MPPAGPAGSSPSSAAAPLDADGIRDLFGAWASVREPAEASLQRGGCFRASHPVSEAGVAVARVCSRLPLLALLLLITCCASYLEPVLHFNSKGTFIFIFF